MYLYPQLILQTWWLWCFMCNTMWVCVYIAQCNWPFYLVVWDHVLPHAYSPQPALADKYIHYTKRWFQIENVVPTLPDSTYMSLGCILLWWQDQEFILLSTGQADYPWKFSKEDIGFTIMNYMYIETFSTCHDLSNRVALYVVEKIIPTNFSRWRKRIANFLSLYNDKMNKYSQNNWGGSQKKPEPVSSLMGP